MRYNVRPVMTKNDDRQDISQDDIYDDTDSERDKRFDAGIGQFAESGRKANT